MMCKSYQASTVYKIENDSQLALVYHPNVLTEDANKYSESDVKVKAMGSNGLRPPWCKCRLHNSDQTGINDRLVEFRAHYIQLYTIYYVPHPLTYPPASRWFMVRIQVYSKMHS